jgi:hypothetical protein
LPFRSLGFLAPVKVALPFLILFGMPEGILPFLRFFFGTPEGMPFRSGTFLGTPEGMPFRTNIGDPIDRTRRYG